MTTVPKQQHHASCRDSHIDLVFLCSQCGLTEPAPAMVLQAESVSMIAWVNTDSARRNAEKERDRLRAVNADLMAALERYLSETQGCGIDSELATCRRRASAALARAKE